MFIRSILPIAALAAVVAAAPSALQARQNGSGGNGECTTGAVQCCNSVKKASEIQDNPLLGLLGIVLELPDQVLGLGCSSVAGSSSCTQEPVCCNDNQFHGLINIGCSPININL